MPKIELLGVLILAVSTLQAGATVVTEVNNGYPRNSFSCSSTDLVNGLLPVATNYFARYDGGPISNATDGSPGAPYSDQGSTVFDMDPAGWYARYALNTASNPSGYDISRVTVFSGTEDCRANQRWSVRFMDINGVWTSYGPVDYSPVSGAAHGNVWLSVSMTDYTAPLATHVVQVEFDLSYGNMYGDAAMPGTYYREFDVMGAQSAPLPPPVPEPVSLASAAIGLAWVGAYLRRRMK